MEWNVYVWNPNRKVIESFNIFEHSGFRSDCDKAWADSKGNREAFVAMVKRSLLYFFWAKCEWEITLSGWPVYEEEPYKKIDVYSQVMLNWNQFIAYVLESYKKE